MTKVYAVTLGEYSDAWVSAVFSTMDLADSYARINEGHVDVFEIDDGVNEQVISRVRPGLFYFQVSMGVDGQGARATMIWKEEEGADRSVYGSVQHNRLMSTCLARDEQHAIKIVNDRRSGWLAAGGFTGQAEKKRSDYGWLKYKFIVPDDGQEGISNTS